MKNQRFKNLLTTDHCSPITDNQGLTLIEIVIVIVVLAIAMLPLLSMFANVVRDSAEEQIIPTANLLAQELMEEIISKRYDEMEYPGFKDGSYTWTQKRYLGPDTGTGEDSQDKSTFDDVDDFKDWLEDPLPNFPGYSSRVEVFYVFPGDLDTEATIGNRESTDFKKIKVFISFQGEEKVSLVSVKQGF